MAVLRGIVGNLSGWCFWGCILLGLYMYVAGLRGDIETLTRNNSALQQANEMQGQFIEDFTRDVSRQTVITSAWHAAGREVAAEAVEPVKIIERVAYEKPFNLDDRMPDELFLSLCRRVLETDYTYAAFDKGQAASGLDAGLRNALLARCQGENRPTWRESLQWILGMIERITQDRLDKAAIRQYVREE